MCNNNNTTTSTTTPNSQALAAYSNLLTQAGNVASQPYQAFTGELTAPVNAQQQAGIGNINAAANQAQPLLGQAAGLATSAAAPITGATIAQYQSPFTQQVVNATEAQMNQQNAMQQSQVTANAGAQGALGGNRVGVAQGTLAGQQTLADNSTIAGLENQGFTQALGEANTEQQNTANAAFNLGNIGTSMQNAALQGAGAQVSAGTLEQQTQQAQDTAAYQQFLNQQAYPYQNLAFEAGIDTGVGSQMGGTSTTTAPPPSILGSILGAGALGLGAFNAFSASDRRLKHNVARVGKTDDGQTLYRFQYKNDPSGRWHIGLMADEVEKKHPEAVAHVGRSGLGVVDYKAATDGAVGRRFGGGLWTGGDPDAADDIDDRRGAPALTSDDIHDIALAYRPPTDKIMLPRYGAGIAHDAGYDDIDGLVKGLQARPDMFAESHNRIRKMQEDNARDFGRKGLASGGVPSVPYAGGQSYVPTVSITSGKGAPPPPSAPQQPGTSTSDVASLLKIMGGGKGAGASSSNGITTGGDASGNPGLDLGSVDWTAGGTLPGLKKGGRILWQHPRLSGFGTGGVVRHFDDGGGVDTGIDGIMSAPTNADLQRDWERRHAILDRDRDAALPIAGLAGTPSGPAAADRGRRDAPLDRDPNAGVPVSGLAGTPSGAAAAPPIPARSLGDTGIDAIQNAPFTADMPRPSLEAEGPPMPPAPAPYGGPSYALPTDYTGTTPEPAAGLAPAATSQGSAGAPAPALPPAQTMGQPGLPRGIRNNNPGNIKDGEFAQNLPGYAGSDGTFARFDSPEAGHQAQVALLGRYGKQGIDTVAGVVSRWAPASDGNDVRGYAQFVASRLGVSPNDPINLQDPAVASRLASVMAQFENGTGAAAHFKGDGQTAPGVAGLAAAAPSRGAPSSAEAAPSSGIDGFLHKLTHMSPEASNALMVAGLSMMANRSPYAMQQVGEGGLAGLGAYNAGRQETTTNNLNQRKLDLEAAKFGEEQKYHQGELDVRNKALEVGHYQFQDGRKLDPATGNYVDGVWRNDTKTGNRTFLPGESITKPGAGAGTQLPTEAWSKNGDEFLHYLPPDKQNLVKKVANYDIDPKTLSVTGGRREETLNLASQYDPSFDQKNYNARYNAVNKFATGPQGQNLTSLNTTMYHLDTLGKAVEALNNGNVQAFNQVGNFMSRQFGYSNVTNFEAVRDVAADEVVKSVLGTAGSDADRQEMRKSILATASPAQLHGVIDRYEDLMAGRLHSLRYTFKDATGLGDEAFDRKLTPETRERLGKLESGAGAGNSQATTAGGQGAGVLDQARAAIARGAPRDAVIQRLRQNGIDPSGL